MCSEYSENQRCTSPIVDDDYQNQPRRPEPLEDYFVRVTEKQITHIEHLCESLRYSEQTRNSQISRITGKSFSGLLWNLSRSQASQVIDKFKEWKEKMK